MAATYTDADRNAMADAEAARITHLSMHTGNPGTTGANEASGGSPAYARKPVTFNAAGSAGPLGSSTQPATVGVAWSNEVTFDLNTGNYTHAGGWSALTGGSFRVGNALGAAQNLSAQGTVKVSVSVGPVTGA